MRLFLENLSWCLCRIRISEGFHFAASGEGIVNMVIELPMKVTNRRTPNHFKHEMLKFSFSTKNLCTFVWGVTNSPNMFPWNLISILRACQATRTERVTLVLFSTSCFHLTQHLLRTGKTGINHLYRTPYFTDEKTQPPHPFEWGVGAKGVWEKNKKQVNLAKFNFCCKTRRLHVAVLCNGESNWKRELWHTLILLPHGNMVHVALNSSKQIRFVNLSQWFTVGQTAAATCINFCVMHIEYYVDYT